MSPDDGELRRAHAVALQREILGLPPKPEPESEPMLDDAAVGDGSPNAESLYTANGVLLVLSGPAAAEEPELSAAIADETLPAEQDAQPMAAPERPPPASPAAQRQLSAAHREHLRTSGLTDETLALAELYTEHDPRALARIIERTYLVRWGSAIVIPFTLPRAAQAHANRVRPDKPRVEERNGKQRPVKYDQSHSAGQLVYFPPRARAGDWCRDTSRTLYWCEGEKKGLALDQLGLACVALTGCWNYLDPTRDKEGPDVLDPQIAKHVVIAERDHVIVVDRDYTTNKQIRHAARRLGSLLYALVGRSVRQAMSDVDAAKGPDDYLALCGEAATVAMLARARPVRPPRRLRVVPAVPPPTAAAGLARRRAILVTNDQRAVVADSLVALRSDPDIYQRGGCLVRMTRDAYKAQLITMPPDTPRIGLLPRSALAEALSAQIDFVAETPKGVRAVQPPDWLVRNIMERGQWTEFPPLAAVVGQPVMRHDGSIVDTQGYDRATGLYLVLDGTYDVPTAPTREDAAAALRTLSDVVSDFPFVGPAHRAGWLAYVLTIVGRHMFGGATPLFLFDAAAAGSGKGLLVTAACLIATGREPTKMQLSTEEPERRKAISTISILSPRCLVLDNVQCELGGAALCDLLTSTRWEDRRLGELSLISNAWTTVMAATGNNVRLGPDMHRRVVHIRLEPACERPEERSNFAHADLAAWIRREQPRLLAAVLTVLRAYVVADQPPQKLTPWGSYEQWSAAVRAPLVWLGEPDPAAALVALRESGATADLVRGRVVAAIAEVARALDSEHGEFRASGLLAALYERGEHSGQYLQSAEHFGELRDALAELRDDSRHGDFTAAAFGRLLGELRGRIFRIDSESLRLISRTVRGRQLWRIEVQS